MNWVFPSNKPLDVSVASPQLANKHAANAVLPKPSTHLCSKHWLRHASDAASLCLILPLDTLVPVTRCRLHSLLCLESLICPPPNRSICFRGIQSCGTSPWIVSVLMRLGYGNWRHLCTGMRISSLPSPPQPQCSWLC